MTGKALSPNVSVSAQIAAAVFVEHGGHGGESAAPIVHDMFQVFYSKENKPGGEPMQLSLNQQQSPPVAKVAEGSR